MKLTFLGANHEVTGSCTLLEAAGQRYLIDCGMEQGKDVYENQPIPVAPGEIDGVLATHAHIDHTGLLPLLVRNGFRGRIYATRPTAELCSIMLRDSAHIQEFEAEWKNRKGQRSGAEPVEPMYTIQDAEAAIALFRGYDYNKEIELAPGIVIRFVDVGHLLGSSSIEIWVTENGATTKLVFSGDIGNHDQPIIKDPTYLKDADYVFMESTYGDRSHGPRPDYVGELTKILQRTFDRGGNVVIPSFAVGRTQELLYFIREIKEKNLVTGHGCFPVYIDSPLAIRKDGTWYAYGWDLTGNVTEIFGKAGYLRTVYTYTPYGEATAEGDVTQPIQWSSEYNDEELGLVYYNYRHLNPHDGRWINRDPIEEQGGWNLFAFAGNSPFLLVDALGLWKKEAGSETIWSAEKNDTLESLAVNEGRNKGDYVCIWPTEGTRDHGYPRKIKPCDKYDVSNLRLPEQENSVELLVADDLFDSYKDIFPGIRKDIEGKNVAKFLQKISQEGKKPITSFILAGHGGRSSKDGNAFTINSLSRLEKKPSFSRAQQKKGPVRCWFSVVATVMFSGCSSSSFAKQFAREFMRKGTTVAGTNQPIGTFVHPVEGPQIVYGYSNDPKTQDLKEDDYYSSKVWEIFNGNL